MRRSPTALGALCRPLWARRRHGAALVLCGALALTAAACGARQVPARDPGIGASGPPTVRDGAEEHRRSGGGGLDPARARAEAQRILAEVARARNLAVSRDVEVDVIDRRGIRDFSRKALYEDTTPEELRRAGRIEASLGAIPVGSDPEKVVLDMLEGSVLGLYDPKSKTLLIGDFVPSLMLSMVVGHEIAHGLQDMHFDLEKIRAPRPHRTDEESAVRFLVEGEAQAAYLAWVSGEAGLAAIDDAVLDALGDQNLELAGESTPYPIVARGMGMPYADGTASIVRLVLAKGWSAVDALYADPPRTTEQMLHLDKLLNREPPIAVELDPAPLTRVLGLPSIWHDQVGEAALLSMLAEVESSESARQAAAGWGGDALLAFEAPTDAGPVPTVVVATVWDSVADAQEFERGFSRYLQQVVAEGTFILRDRDLVVFCTHVPAGVDPRGVAETALAATRRPTGASAGARGRRGGEG